MNIKNQPLTDYLRSKLALENFLSWRKWERSRTHRTPTSYFFVRLTSIFVCILFALILRSLQRAKLS